MNIAELYDVQAIERDFHIEKLLPILLADDDYPIDRKRLVLGKSDIFESKDNIASYVFVIESGVSSMCMGNQIIDFAVSGDFIGLHGEGGTGKTRVSGRVITDELIVWRFKFHDVLAKIMNIQEGYLYLYNYMMSMYRTHLKKMMALRSDKQQRVLAFLQILAEKSGENDEPSDEFIKLPSFFTRKLLGDYIKVSPMTLNTTIKQLEEENHIIVDDRFTYVRLYNTI